MVAVDTRKIVGSSVQALAKHVLGAQESKNRYGSLWDTKKFDGIVESFVMERNPTTKTRQS